MEKESFIRSNNNTNIMSSVREKNGGDGSLLLRASSDSARQATTSNLVAVGESEAAEVHEGAG